MRCRCKVPCTSSHPFGSLLAGSWDHWAVIGASRSSCRLPQAPAITLSYPKKSSSTEKSRYLADLRHLIGLTYMLVPAILATYSGPQIHPTSAPSLPFSLIPPLPPETMSRPRPRPLRISLGTSRFWHDTPSPASPSCLRRGVFCSAVSCKFSKRCPSKTHWK